MRPFALRLERRGYRTSTFVYHGRDDLAANIERLAQFVRSRLGNRPAHFIGHSLGGVLTLETLNRHRDIRAATVLLVGAPARGCLAGRRLARSRWGRWMLGGCAARWDESEARWQRPEPLGVVAGTRAFGLGRVLGPLPGENDGVVRVEETTVRGMVGRALVRDGHSMLIVSSRVLALTLRFLEQGRFD